MGVTAAAGFLRFFNDLPDRRAANRVHRLPDLIVIAVMAVICGADGWVQVAQFAEAKHEWLATFLELPGGIPSHDTFGRVFARLDLDAFERCFTAWMSALGRREQPALAAGRQLRRGPPTGPGRPRGRELLAAVPDRVEPAQAGDDGEVGIKTKRLRAGWDHGFLLKLVSG